MEAELALPEAEGVHEIEQREATSGLETADLRPGSRDSRQSFGEGVAAHGDVSHADDVGIGEL